jgi:hypothetical protein
VPYPFPAGIALLSSSKSFLPIQGGAVATLKQVGEEHMVTFVGTLMIGAVVGFMVEQQWGIEVIRWNRMRRMRTRILRRQDDGRD